MTMRPGTVAAGILGLALLIGGVKELREATLSTHQSMEPGSRVELVVQASTHRGEKGQSLQEMVEALLVTCRLEVTSDIDLPVRDEGDGRFRAVVRPDLDRTDRRQLRGCIEDWTIDQLRVDVVGFEPR